MKLYTSDTQSGSFDQIIESLKMRRVSLNVQHIIIVPDRFTLQTETETYRRLNIPGSFDIDITTFSRLFSRICAGAAYLSTNAASMAIERIMEENRHIFLCFTKRQRGSGCARRVLNTIVNFKGCGITPDMLISDRSDNFANKLNDLRIIYSKYEEFLATGKYADYSDKLTLLTRAIPGSALIKTAYFYLCNFDTVSAQTLAILKELDRYSLGVAAAVTKHKLPAFDNTQYDKLSAAFPDCEIYAEDTRKTAVTSHMLTHLFEYPVRLCSTNSITVYEAPYDGAMTDKIIRLISEKVCRGYRYRDIAIVGNVPEPEARRIAEYGIPVNYERKLPLLSHPAVRLIADALIAVSNGFRLHGVLAVIKNPLFGVDRSMTADYENFCLKYNISGGIFKPFVPRDDKIDNIALDVYESVRMRAADMLGNFSERLVTAKTAKEFTAAVRGFMEDARLSARLSEFNAHIAPDYMPYSVQAEEKLNKILTDIDYMFDTLEYSVQEFLSVLIAGAEAEAISIIPPLCDAVYIAPPTAFCLTKYPVMIFYGMNDGVLPSVERDDGIITDANIDELKKSGIEVEPKSKQVNDRNRHELIMTAALCEELYFLYSLRSRDGSELKKSVVLTAIESIFTGIEYCGSLIEEQAILTDIALSRRETELLISRMFSNPQLTKNLAERFSQTGKSALVSALTKVYPVDIPELPCSLDPIAADSLFFYRGRTSITRLERYFACPYKNFLESGLKLRERDDGKIKAIGVGNILHEVAQMLMTELPTTEDICKARAEEHLDRILSTLYLDDTTGTKAMLSKLRVETSALAEVLFRQTAASNFKPIVLEGEFDDGGAYPPIPLNCDIAISGKIDRVDTYNGYAAVIDYKTGSKIAVSPANFLCGDIIQLPVYMQALKMRGHIPAGLLYFPIRNEYLSDKKLIRFKMYGLISSEPEVYLNLDTGVCPGESSAFYPIKLTKDGVPNKTVTGMQAPTVLNNLCEYVIKMCSVAAKEIRSGFIQKMPSQLSNPCLYCLAKRLCGYEEEEFLQAHKTDFAYPDIFVRDADEF